MRQIGLLQKNSLRIQQLRFIVNASMAVFITYLCMYAFRKPFTSATYEGLELYGINYKIILILFQLIGYTISKYIGIKYISELKAHNRLQLLILLMLVAIGSLFLFGLTPYPYNAVFMLLNGLPLGMIWGVVFSFIEGRRSTELLGAIMASSFIVSSGIVKYSGRAVMNAFGTSEMWMPLITALLFCPVLIIGMYFLYKIPPPEPEDIDARTERIPMNMEERKQFIGRFGFGIFFSTIIYVALTVFRDMRDNFAVEFWNAVGYGQTPEIFAISEFPIAITVMLIISLMILVKNNKTAFYSIFGISFLSGVLLILITILFESELINGVYWMIISGFAMYLPYIGYHTIFFERWIAYFKNKGNAGFLMYIADSAGYLGSTIILLIKNFATPDVAWILFFKWMAIIIGLGIVLFTLINFSVFKTLEKRLNVL